MIYRVRMKGVLMGVDIYVGCWCGVVGVSSTSFLRSLWVRMKDSLKYMFTVPGTGRNNRDLTVTGAGTWGWVVGRRWRGG